MRFFKIDGKQYRALPYENNKDPKQDDDSKVYVKAIPYNCEPSDLYKAFEYYGKIKRLNIALNADHSSKGYGFITFEDEATANKAIKGSADFKICIAEKST